MSSVVTLRTSVGYKIGIKKNTEPDKLAQFLTGVSEAGERLFKIIIDWIYTAEHDEAIVGHIRQKRNAKDVVKLPPIADAIKEIAEQVEQQKEAAQDHGDEEEVFYIRLHQSQKLKLKNDQVTFLINYPYLNMLRIILQIYLQL